MSTQPHVIRYVVTHILQSGVMRGHRGLTFAQQGRNTYATPEQAQAWIEAARKNNSTSILAMYGTPDTLEVRAARCYPGHFDPMDTWFEEVTPNHNWKEQR